MKTRRLYEIHILKAFLLIEGVAFLVNQTIVT